MVSESSPCLATAPSVPGVGDYTRSMDDASAAQQDTSSYAMQLTNEVKHVSSAPTIYG